MHNVVDKLISIKKETKAIITSSNTLGKNLTIIAVSKTFSINYSNFFI